MIELAVPRVNLFASLKRLERLELFVVVKLLPPMQ